MDGALVAFATSTALVAVAEIGDKTQLLSFALAARYRDHAPIIWGILVATLANHALAGTLGVLIAAHVSPGTTLWLVGLSFMVFGVWALFPDKLQLTTVGLGARFGMPVVVTLGTTLGMMLANVPAVLVGQRLAERFPLDTMRFVAAALFMLTGIATLLFA